MHLAFAKAPDAKSHDSVETQINFITSETSAYAQLALDSSYAWAFLNVVCVSESER